MAAPQQSPEQAFRLRKFQGTNTDIDSTFLGPSLVNQSENWIPAQSYRLGKRPGTLFFMKLGNGILSITDMLVVYAPTGDQMLYLYCRRASDAAVFSVRNEENAITQVTTFASATAWGRLLRFQDRVYALNGVDPIKSWKSLSPLAGDIQTYAKIDPVVVGAPPLNAPPAATATADSVAAGDTPLPDGTYAYTWARYNKTATPVGFYTHRYDAGSLVVPAQSKAVFPVPAAGPAGTVWRLFVAYRGFPVEYATMQADDPAGQTPPLTSVTLTTVDVTDVRCPTVGITRTGNMGVIWRNRVVFSGDPTDRYAVYATDTILPGLEQQTFNQGTFFPVNAKVRLPDICTGVGIAGVTTDQDAQAPLLFFTQTRTFLCMGDPFSTVEEAALVEISSRIGCVGHDSIVNTPVGTIFVGVDSVYIIPPGGGYPQDIGWPIADQIRAIPPGLRATVVGQFHKQFYKLAIPPRGGGLNSVQWWLDLRQGVGDIPSWWGPHTGTQVVAVAADLNNLNEIDRGYAAHSADLLVYTHQATRFADYTPTLTPPGLVGIKSVLRSGRFDADQPFSAKVFTRLRLIAQTNAHSFIHVTMKTDDGVPWTIEPIELGLNMQAPGEFVHLTALPPPIPDKNAFNHGRKDSLNFTRGKAQFGSTAPVEIQTITPAVRPRGLSVVVTLTHQPEKGNEDFAARVELRDFELLYIPSERKVRYVGESTGR
jgi:hypothetical protein